MSCSQVQRYLQDLQRCGRLSQLFGPRRDRLSTRAKVTDFGESFLFRCLYCTKSDQTTCGWRVSFGNRAGRGINDLMYGKNRAGCLSYELAVRRLQPDVVLIGVFLAMRTRRILYGPKPE